MLPSVAGISRLLMFARDAAGARRRGRCDGSPSCRCCSCRRRSSAACCARGSRAAASPTCSARSARCAARSCRRGWRRPPAIRAWCSRTARVARDPPPAASRSRPVAAQLDGGALVYDAALDEDPGLIEVVAAAAAIALEHDRLETESRASRQRLVAAGDAERRRLERDLHDGAQQRLVSVAIQLRLIEADIRRDPAAAEARVTSASGELARSLEELRELARGSTPPCWSTGSRPR